MSQSSSRIQPRSQTLEMSTCGCYTLAGHDNALQVQLCMTGQATLALWRTVQDDDQNPNFGSSSLTKITNTTYCGPDPAGHQPRMHPGMVCKVKHIILKCSSQGVRPLTATASDWENFNRKCSWRWDKAHMGHVNPNAVYFMGNWLKPPTMFENFTQLRAMGGQFWNPSAAKAGLSEAHLRREHGTLFASAEMP
eukprot:1161673-Pelagomonas_calceolata.AAC.3